MELKFLENIQVELEFFEWNLSSTIYLFIYKFHFTITRLSKNRVLHFLKIEFQNKSIFLNNFKQWTFCQKVCEKRVKPHFGPKYLECFLQKTTHRSTYWQDKFQNRQTAMSKSYWNSEQTTKASNQFFFIAFQNIRVNLLHHVQKHSMIFHHSQHSI